MMNNQLVGRGWRFPPRINEQGGIDLASDDEEIAEAIRIILSTAQGERVMRPDFGSRLHELHFAPINVETIALAGQYVKEALAIWEPRITLRDIVVHDPFATDLAYLTAYGCLAVEIHYTIKTTGDQRSLVYPFYLIPGE